MIKVSYEKLAEFRNAAQRYVNLKENQGKYSKFLYAVTKMLKVTKPLSDELDDKLVFLNLEYAEKEKGFAQVEKFMKEDRAGNKSEDERYKYSAEKSKQLHKAKRELMQEEVEIEPYDIKGGDLLDFVPNDMDFHKWQFFAPFVLPEEPPQELFDKLIERTSKIE